MEVGVFFPKAGHFSDATAVLAGAWAALVAPLAAVGLTFLYHRKRASVLRIAGNALLVGKKSYPMDGLVGAARDPEVLRGARTQRGNKGIGAITGRFKSKRIGRFDAVLTDVEKAVVLRWPDKALAVSPNDPEFFILMVRKSAGLPMTRASHG
jgi:hypothetical protein